MHTLWVAAIGPSELRRLSPQFMNVQEHTNFFVGVDQTMFLKPDASIPADEAS